MKRLAIVVLLLVLVALVIPAGADKEAGLLGTAESLGYLPLVTGNRLDDCPNDPLKTEPGACGCGVSDTDGDGDGTPDCNDDCPSDPEKTTRGTCGCGVPDTDGDGDGTPDCLDDCPADPGKIAPGTCGCGVPDTDRDGDGALDCLEDCPDDPGKTDPGICGCGVPDSDRDGDGALDCLEDCPDDPLKTEPGACGCGVADIDSDGDGTLDCLERVCGVWPLAFHKSEWASNETDTGIWCDEWFYVWNDSFFDFDCFITDELGSCIPFCEACLCDQLEVNGMPSDGQYPMISAEQRGWLSLPRPEPPYEAPACADNCSAAQIRCWINEGGYSAPLTINPEILGHDLCLPGQPGVSNDVRYSIYDQMGTEAKILLWDDEPCTPDMIEGECPGTPYHIVDWGCIQVDPTDPTPEIDIPANPEYFVQPYCMQNLKVLKFKRLCPRTRKCEGIPPGPP